MIEVWIDIPFLEHYQISTFGRIKSVRRNLIMKTPLDSTGYPYVCIYQKTYRVHQLMAVSFLGHKINKYESIVDHIDGNPKNNYLYNLQIISQRDNILKNKRKPKSNYPGVHWSKDKSKWTVRPYIKGKSFFLGYFKNKKVAHAVYCRFIRDFDN